jgi:hypothetical protein
MVFITNRDPAILGPTMKQPGTRRPQTRLESNTADELEPTIGLEPMTCGLRNRCSTN